MLFYPETKGKTLEEMDGLFGKIVADVERDSDGGKQPERVAQEGVTFEQEALHNQGKK